MQTLFEWRTDLASVHLWSASRRPMTLEQFQQEFRAMATGNLLLLFELTDTREPIGFAQVAQIDLQHKHAAVLFFICAKFRTRRRLSLDSILLLQRYLFEYFPFRKLYADVLAYNRDTWGSALKLGWTEEGRYREHTWFRDRYWDQLRLSIKRQDWQEADARYRTWLELSRTRRERLRRVPDGSGSRVSVAQNVAVKGRRR